MHHPSSPVADARYPEIFGDEFRTDSDGDDDEDLYSGVADGFRPQRASIEHGALDVSHRQSTSTRLQDPDAPAIFDSSEISFAEPSITSAQQRDSTYKSLGNSPNPFSHVADNDEDEDEDDVDVAERPTSLEFDPDEGLSQRSYSVASSRIYARSHSPRFGIGGPSHPYTMHHQGITPQSPGRTIAASPTSTPNIQQTWPATQQGPQHPYNLYHQGVSDDIDFNGDESDDEERIQNPFLVGMPGREQTFTRRRGPDGEDQDIIGPDGHTEQLPPYSRYPDEGPGEGPEKMPLLPAALHSRAPVAGTDPTMPLMHTALLPTPAAPQPQSMTDESALAANAEAEADSAGSANRGLITGRCKEEPKSWRQKSWKEKKSTKFCGIPFWVYLSVGCTLLFLFAILSGVVGGFVAGDLNAQKKAQKSISTQGAAAVITVVTSLYDASQIAQPSITPASGTYALTMGAPQAVETGCLVNAAQAPAWDCNLSPNPDLTIFVGSGGGPVNNSGGAAVFYNPTDTIIRYGAQASSMNTTFALFLTVLDNDAPSEGPAFYFSQQYDKVVVVPPEAIALPLYTSSSNVHQRDRAWGNLKDLDPPAAGEQPWFCVWNNTFLEGFIYVTQQANFTQNSSSSSSSSGPITSATSSPTSLPPSSGSRLTSGPITGPMPLTTAPSSTLNTIITSSSVYAGSSIITTTVSALGETATFTGPASIFSNFDNAAAAAVNAAVAIMQAQSENAKTATTTFPVAARSPGDWDSLPGYPYMVKLEERRVPNNPIRPYCQKYQILYDGSANVVTDPNGNSIVVMLDEQDPSYGAYVSAGLANQDKRSSRRGIQNSCHCQWISGDA